MGLFICDMCGFEGGLGCSHTCTTDGIRKHVARLEEQAGKDRREADDVREAVKMLLKDVPSLDGEEVTVKTEWLKKIYAAACGKYEGDACSFLRDWIVTHRILCEAFELFQTKVMGKRTESVLAKLTNLKEACEVARKQLEYGDENKFDVTPKDIVGAKRWGIF